MKKSIIVTTCIIIFLSIVGWVRGAEVAKKNCIITFSHFQDNATYMDILNQTFADFSEQDLLCNENLIIDAQNNALKTGREYGRRALPVSRKKLEYNSPIKPKLHVFNEVQEKQNKNNVFNGQLNLKLEGLNNIATMSHDEFIKVKSLITALPHIRNKENEESFALYDAIYTRDSNKLEYLKKYLDMGANPFPFVNEAVSFFCDSDDIGANHSFYHFAIDYSFNHYPLDIAKNLLRLTIEMQSEKSIEIALAIVKKYNMLQSAVDDDPIIPQKAVRRAEFLKLFLDYGVQFCNLPCIDEKMLPFTHEAIKAGNIASLLLLKEHGVDFSDPKLIDTALQTRNFACLSFVAAQQKKIPEFDIDFLSNSDAKHKYRYCYLDEDFSREYDRQGHKALLYARCTGDARPLERFIVAMQKSYKIYEKICELYKEIKKINNFSTPEYFFCYPNNFGKCRMVENLVKEMVSNLSDNKYCLPPYPGLLRQCLTRIQEQKVGTNENTLNVIEQFYPQKNKLAGLKQVGIYSAGLAVPLICLISCKKNLSDFVDMLVIQGLPAILSFSEYIDYEEIAARIGLSRQVTYLNGYLEGLQGEKGKKIARSMESLCQWRRIIPTVFSLTLSTLTFMSFYCFMPESHKWFWFFTNVVPNMYDSYLIGCRYQNNYYDASKANELFKYYAERGKFDGYAVRVKALKLQSEPEEKPVVQPSPVKTFFGAIATFSKNFFGRFMRRIKSIKIRSNFVQKGAMLY